jgi:hypothetical protein
VHSSLLHTHSLDTAKYMCIIKFAFCPLWYRKFSYDTGMFIVSFSFIVIVSFSFIINYHFKFEIY